jgi:hypothetical protein
LSQKGGERIEGRGFGSGRFINSFAVYSGEYLKKFGREAIEARCGMVGHATDGAGDVEWVEYFVQGEAGAGLWREDLAIASEGFEESGLCISVGDKVEVVQATKGAIEGVGVGVELFL